MVTTRQFTITDFEEMGSELDRFELIRGELREVAAAGARHSAIGVGLGAELRAVVKKQRMGTVFGADAGFIVARDPDSLLMPDVSFVSSDRLPVGDVGEAFVPFAPDLAVEIESPSNRKGETLEKIALYLDGGAQLVWLIRPLRRTVTVFRPGEPELVLRDGDTLDGADVVPGFSLPLAELFSDDF